ncbi:MAG: GIY-YIG nuclease family protein, partial [Candidatus Poseidoniaceae archaeon]|nr:GIY-YIG nuclease family protein [Candidatus Poseidoniaceae archaeon]
MVDERSDVQFPLWRKKVDGSLFQHAMTVIPEWVKHGVFDIVEVFPGSRKKDPSSKVTVEF